MHSRYIQPSERQKRYEEDHGSDRLVAIYKRRSSKPKQPLALAEVLRRSEKSELFRRCSKLSQSEIRDVLDFIKNLSAAKTNLERVSERHTDLPDRAYKSVV